MKTQNFKWLYIVVPILIIAVLGSIFVNLGIGWFNSLNKPTQWISNIVIPVVWTVIYLTFAVVLLIQTQHEMLPLSTKILLIVNGVLNILWCLVFFTFKQTFGGNLVIVLNLFFAICLLAEIFKLKRSYGLILSIYPIWLSFATTLNLTIWILN